MYSIYTLSILWVTWDEVSSNIFIFYMADAVTFRLKENPSSN